MSGDAIDTESFGGFALGNLQLALPMSALREVMPCTDLADLPCPAPCVIGGITVRGVVVPVVDLRIALGRPAPAADYPNVVLMVSEGRILGLLADSVTGIFELPKRTASSDGDALVDDRNELPIFLRGAVRPDTRQVVSLLSPAALARLNLVAMVEDPEPARQRLHAIADDADGTDPVDPSVPMMLIRCGQAALAIEAMLVHATLADPVVEASALRGGHCRGVIAYDGARVPAIDLQSLCGLGSLDTAMGSQAFVVSLPAGRVAFLIGSVVDVVRTVPEDVKPVPAFSLPRTGFFAGSLPVSTLPADVAERTGTSTSQYLVLASEGLTTCDEVVALSTMNTTADLPPAAGKGPAARTGGARRSMITYLLTTERASPLEQVTEILAYEPDDTRRDSDGAALGFMVNRGRTIPMLCLARAMSEALDPPTRQASVLLVESEGDLIGFVVPVLGTIEQAEWEPALPRHVAGRTSQPLALLGAGEGERMLRVIDLHRLAMQFRQREDAESQESDIGTLN